MVANFSSANARGDWPEVAKSMEENDIPPEETSGTPEMVVSLASQVTLDARELAAS